MEPKVPNGPSREGENWRARLAARLKKFFLAIAREFEPFHPGLVLARIVLYPLPPFVGNSIRRLVLRAAGFEIGRGTVFWGTPCITGNGKVTARLRIGEGCLFNFGCIFDAEDAITIGNGVALGHEVLIITGSHDIGTSARRAGKPTTAPVVIEDGVWVGSRSTILPGVTIGAGSIIGAGSVVNRDVAPNSLAAGQPARFVRSLDGATDDERASVMYAVDKIKTSR